MEGNLLGSIAYDVVEVLTGEQYELCRYDGRQERWRRRRRRQLMEV